MPRTKADVLQSRIDELLLAVAAERSARERAESENRSLVKKIERLSLRIIELWGKEIGDAKEDN